MFIIFIIFVNAFKGSRRNAIDWSEDNIKLYNIESDPNEEDNVFEKFPDIVDYMIQRLQLHERGMIKCQLPKIDIRADPALHNGFWQPWQ